MPTAIDIIRPALQMIGKLPVGTEVSVPPEMASTGRERLNGLLGTWRLKRFIPLYLARETFTLTANQGSRTIGPSGNLVAVRPAQFLPNTERAAIVPLGQTSEIPIRILLHDEWTVIPDKTTTAEWPTAVHYEPTPTNGTFYFYPVPTTAATLVTYRRAELSNFADLNATNYELPDGYDRMLQTNLAVELCTLDFFCDVPPRVLEIAVDTLAAARNVADVPQELMLDPSMPGLRYGGYDIWKGPWG